MEQNKKPSVYTPYSIFMRSGKYDYTLRRVRQKLAK